MVMGLGLGLGLGLYLIDEGVEKGISVVNMAEECFFLLSDVLLGVFDPKGFSSWSGDCVC
jgi:hypothetical protein